MVKLEKLGVTFFLHCDLLRRCVIIANKGSLFQFFMPKYVGDLVHQWGRGIGGVQRMIFCSNSPSGCGVGAVEGKELKII